MSDFSRDFLGLYHQIFSSFVRFYIFSVYRRPDPAGTIHPPHRSPAIHQQHHPSLPASSAYLSLHLQLDTISFFGRRFRDRHLFFLFLFTIFRLFFTTSGLQLYVPVFPAFWFLPHRTYALYHPLNTPIFCYCVKCLVYQISTVPPPSYAVQRLNSRQSHPRSNVNMCSGKR